MDYDPLHKMIESTLVNVKTHTLTTTENLNISRRVPVHLFIPSGRKFFGFQNNLVCNFDQTEHLL
jgi:hypothetical protein